VVEVDWLANVLMEAQENPSCVFGIPEIKNAYFCPLLATLRHQNKINHNLVSIAHYSRAHEEALLIMERLHTFDGFLNA
jgi:hypothetical protein